MAEIKIERKKGMPVWAWLLALLLLVLLVWAALAMRDENRDGSPQDVAVLAWSVPAAAGLSIELAETQPALSSPKPNPHSRGAPDERRTS